MVRILAVFLAVLLAGCAPDGSFRAAVNELDTRVPGEAASEEDAGAPSGPETGTETGPADETATADTPAEPEPEPEPEPAPQPAPAPLADSADAEQPTPAQPRAVDPNAETRRACERGGGNFTKTRSGNFVCVNFTGEARKQCSSPDQCAGGCLARSQTCSPVTPLIGCHQLITGSGGMATVCVD